MRDKPQPPKEKSQPVSPLRAARDEHCPLGSKPCRHCSLEIYKEVKRVPDFTQHKMIISENIIPLGAYCNNACCWVSDLQVCPIPAAMSKALTENYPSELTWARRKGL